VKVFGGLFGGIDSQLRPIVQTGALLFSVLTVIAGLVAEGWQWGVLGVAVGVPGIVLPYVARRKLWSAGRMWLLLAFIVVLDFGVMSAVASTPGT
jgi:predicted PurR-regulated permease PerM